MEPRCADIFALYLTLLKRILWPTLESTKYGIYDLCSQKNWNFLTSVNNIHPAKPFIFSEWNKILSCVIFFFSLFVSLESGNLRKRSFFNYIKPHSAET